MSQRGTTLTVDADFGSRIRQLRENNGWSREELAQRLKSIDSNGQGLSSRTIARPDHQLGIDAFVADAMRLSPNVTPTQALKLLQSCINLMPKTGGNNRPVGRPGWFLLSASEQYFKRAWANTFDFLPLHWQNQQKSASRWAFNRSKPRASHF